LEEEMSRTISVIFSSILIFFGVLFLLGAFSPDGSPAWIVIGLILVGIAIAIIWIGTHKKAAEGKDSQNVTLKIDLPGNVSLDTMKCKSCGGNLSAENVKMVAGAPQVTCPFCHTQYQLTEDPKW
jgi:hypothetical protein